MATSDVFLYGKSYPVNTLLEKYPYVTQDLGTSDSSKLASLLGTSQVFECKDRPTIGILFTNFIPGRSYEENPIAKRYAGNVELDIDLRSCILSDYQWNREVQLRQALEDLRRQTDLKRYHEIEFLALHSKHFNEYGAYFQILRKFFVLEVRRTFNLNLKVGKKYLEFLNLDQKKFDEYKC